MRRILLVISAALILGCTATTATRYEGLLDELSIPASWELVHAEIVPPDGSGGCLQIATNCPSVSRYYLVDDQPIETYRQATRVLQTAGFVIEQEFDPECDAPPSNPACALRAVVEREFVRLSVYHVGQDSGEGLDLAEDGRTLLRITASAK